MQHTIHPTAILQPGAKLHPTVRVGPYCLVDAAVELGEGCVLDSHVVITGVTQIGARNRFHAGCVIGDEPQDLKYHGEPTQLVIGNNNVFREHVTIHRSNKTAGITRIGSDNFLMQHSHVAHDCVLGDHVIMANGALLAGHVTVQDRVFISGNAMVHQFVTIGAFAIMQGGSGVSLDVPPYCITKAVNEICGLNVVGLRRAGFSAVERQEIKRAYRLLFRNGLNRAESIERAHAACPGEPARRLIEFVAASKRGVCPDCGADTGDAQEVD
jgi:UDP-N-acetylglucosamine acyltransferase